MTVRSDLEKAIAMAQANKGSYMLFATESEDQKAKSVFQDMAQDMDRHVQILESRMDYLDQHNQLNGGGGGGGGGGGQDGQQKKEKNKNNKQEGNN